MTRYKIGDLVIAPAQSDKIYEVKDIWTNGHYTDYMLEEIDGVQVSRHLWVAASRLKKYKEKEIHTEDFTKLLCGE